MKKLFVVASAFISLLAFADGPQGILPGEPDPNSAPGRDEIPNRVLLDDTKCPRGQKAFFKMKCGLIDEAKPSCDNYTAVTECRKTKRVLKCKKPKIPVPVFTCDKTS